MKRYTDKQRLDFMEKNPKLDFMKMFSSWTCIHLDNTVVVEKTLRQAIDAAIREGVK